MEEGIAPKSYVLATLHRAENVDKQSTLASLIQGLEQVQDRTGLQVILPIHPRTKKNLECFKISPRNIILMDPLGYLDFLWLEKNARIILTDSGGVQEEACILGVGCVTLRESTERPETIEVVPTLSLDATPEE